MHLRHGSRYCLGWRGRQHWSSQSLPPPAKLTQVQLGRHAGGRALVASGTSFSFVREVALKPRRYPGGYTADTSASYDNQVWLNHERSLQLNDKITCTTKGLVFLLHCLSPLMRTLKSVTTLSLLLKTNCSPKRNSYECRNSGTFF